MARGSAADNVITLPGGRSLVRGLEKPQRPGSAGRPRTPTEFDDVVLDLYRVWQENPEDWSGIPVTGEEDAKQVMADLRRAVEYRSTDERPLGLSRSYDEESGLVKVLVHDKMDRGPKGPRGSTNGDSGSGEDTDTADEAE